MAVHNIDDELATVAGQPNGIRNVDVVQEKVDAEWLVVMRWTDPTLADSTKSGASKEELPLDGPHAVR
jgi:hypothetical protein